MFIRECILQNNKLKTGEDIALLFTAYCPRKKENLRV